MSIEIKGLEKLGADEDKLAELAALKVAAYEEVKRKLVLGTIFLRLILDRGGNVPGRIKGKKKHARRAKVALARKANRSRRARGS